MALSPGVRYPGQTDVDAVNYPRGKAKNIAVSGDGTGTPWEKDLANDIFGFQQALLAAAGITPSEDPDTAPVSQYLDAIKALTRRPAVAFSFIHTEVAAGDYFSMQRVELPGGAGPVESTDSGFTLRNAAGDIATPGVGVRSPEDDTGDRFYLVLFSGEVKSAQVTNPKRCAVQIMVGGAQAYEVAAMRWSADADDEVPFSAATVVRLFGTEGNDLRLLNTSGGGETITAGRLVVMRVSGGMVAGW